MQAYQPIHLRMYAFLALITLVGVSGLSHLEAQQKYKTYFFQENDVVFEFDVRAYLQAQSEGTLSKMDFEDLDIHTVAVTGTFNNWSKKGWRMKQTGPYTFQLRKKISEFNDALTWEFKFLINGRYMLDPNVLPIEQKIIPVDIWEDVYNLDVYHVQPVSKGNAVFFLKGYPDAGQVILTGSFNGWNEHALKMERMGEGWAMELELPPGHYEYKFIVDGEWMHDPANPKWVHNEHGTLNSVLLLTKTIVFSLEGYPTAKRVVLSGSFNDWATNREIMARTDTGWRIALELTPGKHYYKFIVDGQWITDPHNPLSEYDWSGNLNSILLVQ